MNQTRNSTNSDAVHLEGTDDVLPCSSETSQFGRQVQSHIDDIHSLPELLGKVEALAHLPTARILQSEAYLAVGESLRKGEKSGVLKLPTGTGKTRIFANLLYAFKKNGLTLVPRVDLYDSTAREFREAGFLDRQIKFLHDEWGSSADDRMLGLLTDPNVDWSSGRIQCVMTYQSLTSLVKKNPGMRDFMRTHFDVVIEDEAHRGLGMKTKIAKDSLMLTPEETSEVEAENVLGIGAKGRISDRRYNYKFTATPDLLGKSVSEDGEYTYYATVESAVRTGAIVLPQYVDIGAAYTNDSDLSAWKVSDIDRIAETNGFSDASGVSVRDRIIDAYLEKKNRGPLPAVAFASTIVHARQIVEAMGNRGVRATCVTSASGDRSSATAIRMMEADELDVIVTVTKVSEGFDYPPLACTMWFAPSLSPAKILQGNGRIMRYTDSKRPDSILDPSGKLKPSPTSFIIAPSVWYGGSSNFHTSSSESVSVETSTDTPSKSRHPDRNSKKHPKIGNFYELLIGQGELDSDCVSQEIQNIVAAARGIICEVGEEMLIEGIRYVGVVHHLENDGVKGSTVIKKIQRESSAQILYAHQSNGLSIQLVPKGFVDSLKSDHRCELGQTVFVNGTEYVGVTNKQNIAGTKGRTVFDHLKKHPEVMCLPGTQSTGHKITLVPKSFVDSMRTEHYLEVGDKKIFEGVEYIGVVADARVNDISGATIFKYLKKSEKYSALSGKQKNGLPVQLVPRLFIESLMVEHTCEVGSSVVIRGTEYVGIVNSRDYDGTKGGTILDKVRRSTAFELLRGRQKNGLSVNLVPKSFIDTLKEIL